MSYYPLNFIKPAYSFTQKLPGALAAFARQTLATGAAILASLVNKEAGAVVIGEPVYLFAAGQAKKARANAASTSRVIGLPSVASTAADGTLSLVTSGPLTATTGQWDAVTGGSGGLTAGSVYYLSSATAGRLTTIAPNTQNHYVVEVGVALSTTTMLVDIKAPVIVP